MDILKRALVFDKSVLVQVLSAKDLVSKARDYHHLSNTATAALGRTLMAGAVMSAELKGEREKLSITIDGKGPLGKITVAGDSGGFVRGTVDNPECELSLDARGKLAVGEAVGKDGFVTVIKDQGLKEPYVARCELVTGEIAEDLTMYFTISEQRPYAIALGVLVSDVEVISAGGVFIEVLPNCPDHIITVLEDIMTNFGNISKMFVEQSAEQILEYYFGHFDIEYLDDKFPSYRCNCSKERVDKLIINLTQKECNEILSEIGEISIECDFCDTVYKYNANDVAELFS